MRDLHILISAAGDLLNRIIPVLIAAALVVFFWGLVRYISKGKAKGGKDIMIAGLLGLFIMVSVWGIIRLAQNTLFGASGALNQTPGGIPQVPQRSTGDNSTGVPYYFGDSNYQNTNSYGGPR